MSQPLEIFFSYAHRDEELMNDVRRQLIVYERNGRILKWHDRMIPAGSEWHGHIDSRLEAARIVLLFMSPHFIESRYCYEVEGARALEKHRAGEATVIPVILRPCAWEDTPFGKLQALPLDAKPISRWEDRDEACLSAARGVMMAVDKLSAPASGPAARSSPAPQATAVRSKNGELIYCDRCGQAAGQATCCTGAYTHHSFTTGTPRDYCSRCGASPGTGSSCTGAYTHHAFTRPSAGATFCTRCGARPGSQSSCTGAYSHHAFSSR